MLKLMFFVMLFSPFQMMTSQSVSNYQWKNRLLIVLTENAENSLVKEQLSILEGNLKELKERKLELIQVQPGKQKKLLLAGTDWESSNIYKELKGNEADFEVLLIGLDGSIKLRQTKPVKTKQLFDLIDSMPMRQAEIRRKNN
ncbi:MAG: DUF4174 domain-containing protein [Gramella sp.]|nr:DUF4174 domain-containing protein [Christiangramia sp.]